MTPDVLVIMRGPDGVLYWITGRLDEVRLQTEANGPTRFEVAGMSLVGGWRDGPPPSAAEFGSQGLIPVRREPLKLGTGMKEIPITSEPDRS